MDAALHLLRKLALFFRREKFQQELEEEMAFHREQAEKDLRQDGIAPDVARHAARRQFGNPLRLEEQSLESVSFGFETTLHDVRYAARQLRKNPGFAATAILVLAIAIGSCTAIFSAVSPILLEPLPYPQAARIMAIWDSTNDDSRLEVTFGTFREIAQRSRSFETLAVMKPWQPAISGPAEPERFEGQQLGADYFRVLGVQPALGRNFDTADDRPHGPRVVILSDALWRRRFGGDATIVGRQITLDDTGFTVIGVMPAGFENVLAPSAEIWSPLQYDPTLPPDGREWGHHLRMIGRLRDGVSQEQARSELATIAHHTIAEFARPAHADLSGGLAVNSLQQDIAGPVKPELLAVFGAVILVLLIACVNVTNLLLARGAQRRGEFAMRVALGAPQARLLRQLLTESLLVAFLGGGFGLLVAYFGVQSLIALSPAELPRAGAIRLDWIVFAFALLITTLVGLLIGLIPALDVSRRDLHLGIQQSSGRSIGGHQWTRRTLVVAEVALALVLLVSAGLLLRSVQRLFAIDPGFDTSHLLTMQVQTSGHRFDDAATHLFFDKALQAVRQVPGVMSAGFTSQLPLGGGRDMYGVEREEMPNDLFGAFRYSVTPGYVESMRIPLHRGRLLSDHDSAGQPYVVLVSESLARSKFRGKDPIGQRLRIGPSDGPWATVVGVVGDVKQESLALTLADAVYMTTAQWQVYVDNRLWLVVRTQGDPAALAPAVRKAIWSVDKDQPVVRIASMDERVAASASERRFALIVFETFALVALLLAATGLYGVLAGSVTERIREIGVRAALGATPARILGLILGQGLTLTALGVVIGLTAAVVASRALITLLFGISRTDPVTYAGVIALLAAVSAVACWMPAWRAARVDPSVTLRSE